MNNNILETLFGGPDIESIRRIGIENHGIDILGVYCQSTGKRIGTFDESVLLFAIDEEIDESEEALADALVIRTVCSMRPSPMLNKPDRLTISNLSAKYPVDVLAFLIHRLHGDRKSYVNREDSLEPFFSKIHIHQKLTAMAAAGFDPKPWIHLLLELDAKRNLHDLNPPLIEKTLLGKWIETRTGNTIFNLLDMSNHAILFEWFAKWTLRHIEEFDRRLTLQMQEENWYRGNTMTQTAYVKSWIENPQYATHRQQLEAKKKAAKIAKPAKPKSEKAQRLDAQLNAAMSLLDDIMSSTQSNIAVTTTPAKAAPKPLTGNMLFRKKESN